MAMLLRCVVVSIFFLGTSALRLHTHGQEGFIQFQNQKAFTKGRVSTPNVDSIICPFLAALVREGDTDGSTLLNVTTLQTLSKSRGGMNDPTALTFLAAPAFLHPINVSAGSDATLLDPLSIAANRHFITTGIRNPGPPNQSRFQEIFMPFVPAGGKLSIDDIGGALRAWRSGAKIGNPTGLDLMFLMYSAFFNGFSMSDGYSQQNAKEYVPVRDLQNFLLDAVLPTRTPKVWYNAQMISVALQMATGPTLAPALPTLGPINYKIPDFYRLPTGESIR